MANGEGIEIQMTRILDEYSEEVVKATNAAIDKVGKEAVKKLKATSPKKTGKYARSWTMKSEIGTGGVHTVTIYNSKHAFLTHLLENGHVIRNKKGTYGRAPAHPHIKPVEQWANNELPAEIERELK